MLITHLRTYIHISIYIYIYIFVRIYIHTYIHIYKYKSSRNILTFSIFSQPLSSLTFISLSQSYLFPSHPRLSLSPSLSGSWLEVWKSKRIENSERMEKWKDRKYFNFLFLFLFFFWLGVEKWRDGKNEFV